MAMPRFPQVVLIASTLALSWLGMMAVHEFGHVAGAWWSGGVVSKVVLHPLAISRTDLVHNPRPLVVAWSGPWLGAAIPLIVWCVATAARWPGAFWLRFFAGFCLIANGLYLSVGSFDGAGDAGDLLRAGAAMWQLWLFGGVTVPAGLWLWHKQGAHFGFGLAAGRVDVRATYVVVGVLTTVAALELMFGNE